jgi:hypothetical protein
LNGYLESCKAKIDDLTIRAQALTTVDFNNMSHSITHMRLWELKASLPEDVAYMAEI